MEINRSNHKPSFLIYTTPGGEVTIEVFEDVEKVKNWFTYGKEYFEELLDIIRDIRQSEKNCYQKITDLFARCSIDYDPGSFMTNDFFSKVQNKLHWAVTGHTAAEIIARRVDAEKPHMGLTSWKNSPNGPIKKSDVGIAKNYLRAKEVRTMSRIVNNFLEYAAKQVERRVPMTMEDWKKILDNYLRFNEYDILPESEDIKITDARIIADLEYEKFKVEKNKLFNENFNNKIYKMLN